MLAERGYFNAISGDIPAAVTVTLTGHGLKDPDRAIKTASAGIVEVDAQRDAILRHLDVLLTDIH
jgi:hypothetical protein